MSFSNETKQSIIEAQNFCCKKKECYKHIHSIHHKLNDTKYHREKFPLFINSPMNGVGLCEYDHANYPHEFRILENEAEVYEEYLKKLNQK